MAESDQSPPGRARSFLYQVAPQLVLLSIGIAALLTACSDDSDPSASAVVVSESQEELNELNEELNELQNKRAELNREKGERTAEGHTAEEIDEGEVIWEVWAWRWWMEENTEEITEKRREIDTFETANTALTRHAEPRVDLTLPPNLVKEFEEVKALGAPTAPVDRLFGPDADGGDK